MPTKQEKAEAIRQLILNLGDVERTAQETGVSKRSIERWKNKLKSNGKVLFWRYTAKSTMVRRSYEQIRDKMLTEIQQLLNMLPHYKGHQSADLINAISRLTDRLDKIESTIEKMGQYEVIVKVDNLPEDIQEHDPNEIKF